MECGFNLSLRITHGRVLPRSTSVESMTQNDKKIIRLRNGNGVTWSDIVIGNANAAAIETTPRMPAHPNTTIFRGSNGSFSRILLLNQRGTRAAGTTQTKRTRIATMLTAAPYSAS